MSKADELRALADRCEREEPSRALDADIALAIFPDSRPSGDPDVVAHIRIGLISKIVERYTTSLDAAVRPEGADVFWRSGHDGEGPDPSLFKAEVLVVTDTGSCSSFGRARTEAMARRAAELRARASLLEEATPAAPPKGGE